MTVLQKQCLLVFADCMEASSIDGLWGPRSAKATEMLQRKLEIEADGIWGPETDKAVREHIHTGNDFAVTDAPNNGTSVTDNGTSTPNNGTEETGTFWDHIRYWTREEFACRCGEYHAPYCDGYPVEPDQTLVEFLDDIRAHFGRPAHRSSGIRCSQHNADQPGSAANSKHLYGKAMDFFIEGIAGEAVRAYAAADPRCNYTYVITGNYVHVDVK